MRYLHYGEDPLFKFQPPRVSDYHDTKIKKFLSFTNIYFTDLGRHFLLTGMIMMMTRVHITYVKVMVMVMMLFTVIFTQES